MGEALLTVRGLRVAFDPRNGGDPARALRGADLDVADGEVHALVGESGCGKTVTSTCVMGLLPTPPARVEAGEILFEGRDLLRLDPAERRKIRGTRMAMVFQEPSRSLNPAFRIREQIAETLRVHEGMDGRSALSRAGELVEQVGLTPVDRVLRSYPHELSGGMKQRAMIAMAIACHPRLLIADEPTTALDVTLQVQILELLRQLRAALGMAILFISHDLRLVRAIADRVSVMYAGRVVETGTRDAIYAAPQHPYTRLLMQSIPSAQARGTPLRVIPGRVPDPREIPQGCAFNPRCPLAADRCRAEDPVSPALGHGSAAGGHASACHFPGAPWRD